ncbi:MAG TPA: NAD(P)H-hydrate dehydratase [Candidatus Hydrogenedentes bacterium]|nr:NAD(P)H-hydrate dehydratase [Candidatus Hydrogenedentota bacterium]
MPELLSHEEIRMMLPPRPQDGHKGAFGHLFVLAGSRGFTGAAKLTCDAAMRSGVGLVTAGVPAPLADALAAALVEPMLLPLPATDTATTAFEALDAIQAFIQDKSAMVIGPGLSRHPSTMRLARRLVQARSLPLLADADALNAFAAHRQRLTPRDAAANENAVFTPHPGEMARLTGLTTKEIQQDRAGVAAKYAALWRVVVALKGAGTVIAAPDGRIRQCPTGNSGMATGGSGDVLSGVIGALLAQGLDAFNAACAGVYAHGLAGDIAARDKTERALIARDIIDALPQAWRDIEATAP